MSFKKKKKYLWWLTCRRTDHQLAWLVKNMILSPKGSGDDTTDMPSFKFIVGYFCLAHFWADAIEKQNKILTCNYIAEDCGYDAWNNLYAAQYAEWVCPVSWMNVWVSCLGNRQTAQMLLKGCSWSSGFTITLMAVLKYQSDSRSEEAAEKCW